MKKKIDVFEHMGEILNGVKNGVLITGKADGRVNSMTISWGRTRRLPLRWKLIQNTAFLLMVKMQEKCRQILAASFLSV